MVWEGSRYESTAEQLEREKAEVTPEQLQAASEFISNLAKEKSSQFLGSVPGHKINYDKLAIAIQNALLESASIDDIKLARKDVCIASNVNFTSKQKVMEQRESNQNTLEKRQKTVWLRLNEKGLPELALAWSVSIEHKLKAKYEKYNAREKVFHTLNMGMLKKIDLMDEKNVVSTTSESVKTIPRQDSFASTADLTDDSDSENDLQDTDPCPLVVAHRQMLDNKLTREASEVSLDSLDLDDDDSEFKDALEGGPEQDSLFRPQ